MRCRPGGRAGGHGSRARPTLQAGNEPWPPRLGEQRDTGIAAGPVVLAAVSLGEPTSDAHLDSATPRRSSVSRHLAAPPERVCTDIGENPPHRIAVLVVAAEYDLVPSLAGDEAVHRIRSRAGPGGSPGIYARVVEPYDAPPFARWGDGFVAEPRGGQIQTS